MSRILFFTPSASFLAGCMGVDQSRKRVNTQLQNVPEANKGELALVLSKISSKGYSHMAMGCGIGLVGGAGIAFSTLLAIGCAIGGAGPGGAADMKKYNPRLAALFLLSSSTLAYGSYELSTGIADVTQVHNALRNC